MAKAANVKIIGIERIGGGFVTVLVSGDGSIQERISSFRHICKSH